MKITRKHFISLGDKDEGKGHRNAAEFCQWLSQQWEGIEEPVVFVPYRGDLYVAQWSHDDGNVWVAMGEEVTFNRVGLFLRPLSMCGDMVFQPIL